MYIGGLECSAPSHLREMGPDVLESGRVIVAGGSRGRCTWHEPARSSLHSRAKVWGGGVESGGGALAVAQPRGLPGPLSSAALHMAVRLGTFTGENGT